MCSFYAGQKLLNVPVGKLFFRHVRAATRYTVDKSKRNSSNQGRRYPQTADKCFRNRVKGSIGSYSDVSEKLKVD